MPITAKINTVPCVTSLPGGGGSHDLSYSILKGRNPSLAQNKFTPFQCEKRGKMQSHRDAEAVCSEHPVPGSRTQSCAVASLRISTFPVNLAGRRSFCNLF